MYTVHSVALPATSSMYTHTHTHTHSQEFFHPSSRGQLLLHSCGAVRLPSNPSLCGVHQHQGHGAWEGGPALGEGLAGEIPGCQGNAGQNAGPSPGSQVGGQLARR